MFAKSVYAGSAVRCCGLRGVKMPLRAKIVNPAFKGEGKVCSSELGGLDFADFWGRWLVRREGWLRRVRRRM